MRMKHGSDCEPTISVKPRLLAAFTAVAMMFATAVPSLLPQTAVAAGDPGVCQPDDIELGDKTSTSTKDSGIATWVGRDMYVGAPKDGVTSYGQNGNTINQSYAVEAEGTTLVAGKLAINSVKQSWGDYGFRFGIVGFGAQYRPTSGDALVVNGGTNSQLTLIDRDNNNVSALGWGVNGRGWLGSIGENQPAYTAKIKGLASSTMGLQGKTPWQDEVSNSGYPGGYESVYSRPKDSNKVTWAGDVTTNLLENVNINGNTDDYSERTDYFQNLSATLGSVTTAGTTVTSSAAPAATDYIREKYTSPDISNFNDSKEAKSKKTSIGVKMQFDEGTEKRIIFDGGYDANNPNQTSSGNMVAFTLDPAYLSNGTSNGVVFDFRNIKPGASVVVNVKHAESDNQKTITFNNGWRFWWNGMEISNGYMPKWKDSTEQAPGNRSGVTKNDVYEAYGKASQAIIWNFQNTKKLTVKGGQVLANNRATHWANAVWYKDSNATGDVFKREGTPYPDPAAPTVADDPAAAMLGSILVPDGSFEDHVTTNGRVWVGEDFSMYNPTRVWDFSKANEIGEGWSSSIIDMDQERHNFPWSGSARTTCSTLSWTKANENKELLSGTTWGVYGSVNDAKSGQNAIYIVKDNAGEWNPEDGKFRVDNLNPENSYFIKEVSPANGYTLNKYIYEIYAANTGDTSNSEIRNAYDENGKEITDRNKWQLTTVGSGNSAVTAIVNKRSGTDLEWGKTKSGEQSGLSGSEWILTKKGTPDQQWLIKDDVQSLEKIEILDTNGNLVEGTPQITLGSPATFKSRVFPLATANQHVIWSVPEELSTIVSLTPSEDQTSVQIVVHDMPTDGQVTLTATGVDGTTSASITIEVLQPQVSTLEIQPSNDLTVVVDHTLSLNVTGKDSSGNPVQSISPQWTSSDMDKATVSSDGTVTGVALGTVTITATITTATGTVSDSVEIDIIADGTTILAEVPSGWTPYIWAWETNNESNNYTDGKWPGKPMTHVSGSTYSYLVPSTGTISVIISNTDQGKNKTGDITNINGGTAKTWKVTGLTNGDNTGITTATPASTRIGALVRRSADAAASVDTSTLPKKQDENPEAGKFHITNLEDGTYMLKESKAPDGYFLNPTEYTIKIEGGVVTSWTPEPETDSNGLHWISDVPTEFNWSKVDAGYSADDTDPKRNPIAGSKWKLEKFKAPATAGANGTYETDIAEIKDCTSDDQSGCAIDKDDEAGNFKLTGLALGKYRLVETEAPTGYTKLDTYYYFELSTMDPVNPPPVKWTAGDEDSWDKQTGSYNGTATGSSPSESEKAVEVNAAPNYRSLGDVYWGKVSSEKDTDGHHVYLGGSEWSVTYTPLEGDTGNAVTVTIADRTTGRDECTPTEESYPAWACDAYPAEGRIGFRNLPWGTYTMRETKAPDGYYADPDAEYTFTVDANNRKNVKIYKKVPNNDPIEIDKPNNPEGAQLPDFPNQVISNEPGVVLPATGGEGNTLIVLFGFALIAISMLGCGVAMRKRI